MFGGDNIACQVLERLGLRRLHVCGLPVLFEQLERREAADGLVGGEADADIILRPLDQVELEGVGGQLTQRGLIDQGIVLAGSPPVSLMIAPSSSFSPGRASNKVAMTSWS